LIEPHLVLYRIICVGQRFRASILVGFRSVDLTRSPGPQFLARYCGRRALIIGTLDSIFPSLYVRRFRLGLRTLCMAVIRLPFTLMTHYTLGLLLILRGSAQGLLRIPYLVDHFDAARLARHAMYTVK
jgi:hypothetical protein